MADETAADGTVNVDVLARLFNLGPRRVQQLAKEGIIPRAGHGRYPFAAAIRGYISFLQQSTVQQAEGKEVDPDKLNQFQRRAYYAAESLKIKIMQEQGELIPRAEVERDYNQVFTMLAQLFDQIPDMLERDGVPMDAVKRVEHRIETLRREVADKLSGELEPVNDEIHETS